MNDKRLPTERLTVVSYVVVGMIALLLFGFWKLQIVDSDRYSQMAERNRVRSIPIIAPRGSMLDREGRVLVDNYPSFSVLLLRDTPEQVEKLLPQIADGLGMTLDDVKQQIEASRAMPKFQPIVIKPEASPSDIAFIESHRVDIPVLEMLMVHRRRYPHGDMLANAIGYVGEVSAEQVEDSDSNLKPGDIVGKTGLERQYNETLMGTDGLRRVIVNSIGKEVGRLEQKDAIPGKPIQLTIDYDLQNVADDYMADKEGAVVAMDPRTGEILAMVSRPDLRSQRFRHSNSHGGVAVAQHRSAHPAAESRHSGAAGAGFGVQNRDGHGDAGIQGCPGKLHGVLPGPRHVLRAHLPLLAASGTRRGRSAQTPSCNPATFSSTRSASGWASTAFTNMAPIWVLASAPASTCRAKKRASCHRKNGSSACFTTNGMPAKRFRFPSGRGRSPSLRFNWRA